MEDYIIIVIIGLIGCFALTALKMFKPNQGKTKVINRKDKAETTLDKINEDTIVRLSDQLKKEAGRANRLQALKDKLEDNEEIEEEGVNQVTFEEITSLVKASYPKYAGLLPIFEKQIMDATKGMTMEQILTYVKQIKENQQSKGAPSPQASDYNANWA